MATATEKRLLKKAKEESPVTVSGDALIKLLKEMERLRNEIANLRNEVQRNFDTFVEHIPCEVEEGIQFKVFSADTEAPADETYMRVTMPANLIQIKAW